MSSTRHVEEGTRRKQHGWASAPEFDELRGLSGTAVASKAALVKDSRTRSLLFFLQGLSLREGGLPRIAKEIIKMFPECIGTELMHQYACHTRKKLTAEQAKEIYIDLHLECYSPRMLLDDPEVYSTPEQQQESLDTAGHLSGCRSWLEANLEEWLEYFCCDPSWDRETEYNLRNRAFDRDCFDADNPRLFRFKDILSALLEYQRRHVENARTGFVMTSIGEVVFEALDYALETGRTALIEGNSGVGKTTGLKAWCDMHQDRARYVQLKGITHRTSFFREIGRALGIVRGRGLSASKVQLRIEQFLQATKIMLVIDEGQYLMPPGKRISAPPDLINWLMTACYNEGVPFVISATSEFSERRKIVETQTTWQSEQLRRRIRRYFFLPKEPTKQDIDAVTRKLLPEAAERIVDLVAGYAMGSKGFFQALTNAVEDAQLIATRAGRETPRFEDFRTAIQGWRLPCDAALDRVFAPAQSRRRSVLVPAPTPAADPVKRAIETHPKFTGRGSSVPILTAELNGV